MDHFINLNESVNTAIRTAIRIAKSHAREYRNAHYSAPHLLKALLHKEIGLKGFIESMDKDFSYFMEWAEMTLFDMPEEYYRRHNKRDEDNLNTYTERYSCG